MNRKQNRERQRVAKRNFKKPVGKFYEIDLATTNNPNWMTRAFKNNRYIVMIDDNSITDKGSGIKAMIQRHDNNPIPNHWNEIQKIKNELFGKETIGIEYYPKESHLEDVHQIYWLWIFKEDMIPIPKNQNVI